MARGSWATQTCSEALIVVEQGRPFKAIPGYQHRVIKKCWIFASLQSVSERYPRMIADFEKTWKIMFSNIDMDMYCIDTQCVCIYYMFLQVEKIRHMQRSENVYM